jgi:rhodanese-related sulfurtransferase
VPLNRQSADVVIFYCQSGHRTTTQQQRLTALAQGEAYIVEGGLNAWKRAGLPVDRGTGPISIMRQVQIVAGSLALLGTLLGALVSSWFYLLPGFIGAGLMFAGFSGTCALACVLQRLPWNRNTGASCSL